MCKDCREERVIVKTPSELIDSFGLEYVDAHKGEMAVYLVRHVYDELRNWI